MSVYENHIFPPVMEWATKVFRAEIKGLISQAQGRVLEIGAGTGANLSFYPPQVSEVVGIEPVESMLQKARGLTLPHSISITLQEGDARSLPFEDASFDTAVACLVFCTIPDPEKAVAEMHRVLKPGGKLIFFEHVASSNPALRKWQRRINPVWKKLACGCEITRDTRQLFEQAGFRFQKIEDFNYPKVPSLMAPVISGVALK